MSLHAQASSLGFDAQKAMSKAGSFRKREGGPMDLSDQQQRRRASIELGMGGASRSSLIPTGTNLLLYTAVSSLPDDSRTALAPGDIRVRAPGVC